tara:strand:+ start:967 stop:3630 length:2664 start_codon:yes stop_codon:yes gene_type:complete
MVEERRQLDDPVGGLVTLEPEVANYLARLSPDNRRRLREVALEMSPQQQQEVLASMQMGDIRFQSDVMPYMPEGADLIDPLVARLRGVPSDDAPAPVFSKEGSQINPRGLLGLYVSKFYEGDPEKLGRDSVYKRGKSGRTYGFPLETDTVNIYESSAANPQVWAHEYRHRQDLEGGRGDFGVKEIMNRTQDVINANNPRDLRQALAPLAGTLTGWASAHAFRNNRRNLIIRGIVEDSKELDGQINEFQTYMQEVLDDSLNPEVPHAKLVKHAKNILNSKFIQNEFEANEVRASSYDKDRTPRNDGYAELPPLKDRMTREDFREGRVYKDEIDTSFFDRFNDGGLVEERQYDYGLPGEGEASFGYNPLSYIADLLYPYRYPVEREAGIKQTSDEAIPRVVDGRLVLETPAELDPGQYGKGEFGLQYSPVVRGAKAGLEFFGDLFMDPETRQRAADVMRSAPAEIIRQEKLRAGAASMGLENIRDPRSGEVLSTAESVLLAPATTAAGTAAAIRQLTPDQQAGTILGTMGGKGGGGDRINFLRHRIEFLRESLRQDTDMPRSTRESLAAEGRQLSTELKTLLKPPALRAYHASQADFDEFSSDYIGTGEGTQLKGFGHYLAENEDVARIYYDKSAKFPTATDKDSLARNLVDDYYYGDIESLEDEMLELGSRVMKQAFQDKILYKFDDNSGIELDFKKWDETGNLDSSLRPIDLSSGAHMYQVDIDVKPEELLDWDKPLSEQSEKIQKIFPAENYPETYRGSSLYDQIAGSALMSGSRAFDPATGGRASAPQASKHLNSLGIKGIRYKDGFSRGKEGGTSNYVIFDGRLITISKKYGVAVPIAAAMLAKETGQDPTSFYSEDNLAQQKAQGGAVGGLGVYFSKMQMQGA